MIKLCEYYSTMWNRTDSRFVAGVNNIPDRFLCKADFILSRHFALLHSRFVKLLNLSTFQENNPCNRKGPRNGQMGKKRNFIPKQNTHDLLVGTLSIGIRSLIALTMITMLKNTFEQDTKTRDEGAGHTTERGFKLSVPLRKIHKN